MLISIRDGISYFFYADRDIRSELIYARLILDLSSVQWPLFSLLPNEPTPFYIYGKGNEMSTAEEEGRGGLQILIRGNQDISGRRTHPKLRYQDFQYPCSDRCRRGIADCRLSAGRWASVLLRLHPERWSLRRTSLEVNFQQHGPNRWALQSEECGRSRLILR